MSDRARLRGLFADYASGNIADAELQSLEAALREDADLRREFIEYMNVDSALGDLAALSDLEIAELDTVPEGCVATASAKRTPRQRRAVVAFAGGIALALLVAVSLWIAWPRVNPAANLVAGVDYVLKTGEHKAWDDTELPTGVYLLERGLVHLRFGSGVMVYLEAPARFDAVSERRIVLHHGRLSASVPPAGSGFTIETPEAEVIDFGTEFSVDVDGGASEVHVFDGLVRVQPRTAKSDDEPSIDLRTFEAIRIDKSLPQPVGIELATDRFIRSFDEPRKSYPRSVKDLGPVAIYRMPIRDRGMVCEPPQFSGNVLTGKGKRPPHARGFIGGSLRVLADSTGRGGLVKNGPPLNTGAFTLVTLVYAEARVPGGTVITNVSAAGGNFALTLNEAGQLKATVRDEHGELKSCIGVNVLPLKTWHHVVVTASGDQLKLFESGELATATDCSLLQHVDSEPIWFGTDSGGVALWDGRIDEVALFDRALTSAEVAKLYKAALTNLSESK